MWQVWLCFEILLVRAPRKIAFCHVVIIEIWAHLYCFLPEDIEHVLFVQHYPTIFTIVWFFLSLGLFCSCMQWQKNLLEDILSLSSYWCPKQSLIQFVEPLRPVFLHMSDLIWPEPSPRKLLNRAVLVVQGVVEDYHPVPFFNPLWSQSVLLVKSLLIPESRLLLLSHRFRYVLMFLVQLFHPNHSQFFSTHFLLARQ